MADAYAKLVKALFGLVLVAGTAHAGNVPLRWDPSFGLPYPDLGFSGEAVLRYPDACLAADGTVLVSNPCNTGPESIAFTSVTLNLYDFTQPTPTLFPIDFLPSTTPNPLNDIIVASGAVVGLDSLIFGPRTGAVPGVLPSQNVWLQFVTSFVLPPVCPIELECIPIANPEAFMFVAGSGQDSCPLDGGSISCIRSNPATVTFLPVLPVPEPASIHLLAAALAALALALLRGARRPRSS